MKGQRYGFWGYVKSMIYRYPQRQDEYREAMAQSITPNYESMPHGNEAHRTTEDVVIKAMGNKTSLKEYEAVKLAVTQTEAMQDGEQRIDLIRMLYWSRTHTLHGAAEKLHISYMTARRWHWKFLNQVAINYGLI